VTIDGEELQKHVLRRARKGRLLPGKLVPTGSCRKRAEELSRRLAANATDSARPAPALRLLAAECRCAIPTPAGRSRATVRFAGGDFR
jgi:hypothetical protein